MHSIKKCSNPFTLIEHRMRVLVEQDAVDKKWNGGVKSAECCMLEEWDGLVMIRSEKPNEHHQDLQMRPMEILTGGNGREIVIDCTNIVKNCSQLHEL